ncbi:MAG: TIGR01777 family oxidoreductase [Acidimicrobiia bacterium]
MDVAVTGSSGMIGTALVAELRAAGHRVRPLVRREPVGPDELRWDPAAGTIDAAGLAGIDAAVHLAGEGIGDRRWTAAQKRRIMESRTRGTAVLTEALADLDPKPAVLLSGSAIGIYGDGGDEVLTEDSPSRGEGFDAQVARAWEAAARPAVDAGIRTAFLRTGIVQSPTGGALARMLPLFRLGLGGPIGGGHQWWPWISIDDEVGAIRHLLTADVHGPVNLVSPNPVTNAEFTKTLARVLHRPAVLPIPLLGPAVLLGRELATSLLGDSARLQPARLLASGYEFRHPELEGALRHLLDRPA